MLLKLSSLIREFAWRFGVYTSAGDPVYFALLPKLKQDIGKVPVGLTVGAILTALENRKKSLHKNFIQSLKKLKPEQLKVISASIGRVLRDIEKEGSKTWLNGLRELKEDIDRGSGIKEKYDIPNFIEETIKIVQKLSREDNPQVVKNYVDNAMLQYRAAEPLIIRGQLTPYST